MKKLMENIYLIKLIIILMIVIYDCSIESKYTMAWLGLSILYGILHLDTQINKKQ